MGLLDGDLADIINDAMGAADLQLPAVLTKTTYGARDPLNVTGGQAQTMASYTAAGLVREYTNREIDGTRITRKDRRISLFGSSIQSGAVPEPGDRITISGDTYTIVDEGVSTDAAKAVYVAQARK